MEVKRGFPKVIRIGQRLVGEGQPTYFIADIGANFDGSLDKAKRLASAAKEAGADVVKFQSFLSSSIVSGPSFAKMHLKGVHGTWQKPIDQVFREAELPREWHKELFDYCTRIGVTFSSSPYDFEAVDLLYELGVEFFKIGSGEITWHRSLQYISLKGKPMILATGASTLAEIDEALGVIEATGNNQLALLQCITNYPSKIESANINVLKTYQTAFGVITGYSDHSPGDIVVLGSVALGAKVIEKHFTLSKKDKGPDHPHSMEPTEFRQMVEKVRLLEKALGSTRKEVVEEELETVIVQRRSLHAARDIGKGEILKEEDLIELRPAIGIQPKHKQVVVGRRVKAAIAKHEAICWEHLD
jgi:pseudaminic acid synthase